MCVCIVFIGLYNSKCVCNLKKDIGINKETEILLPNKEFMKGVKEQIWLPNVKHL